MRYPVVSAVLDEPIVAPFKNGSGSSLSKGDVQCWKIATTGREETEDPSSANQYCVAGIVAGGSAEGVAVADGNYGQLYKSGRILAQVHGGTAIAAGDRLTVSPTHRYLVKDTGTSGKALFIAMEAYSTAASALKTVQVNLD